MSGYGWLVTAIAGALALIIIFSIWSDATTPSAMLVTPQPVHKVPTETIVPENSVPGILVEPATPAHIQPSGD